MNAVVPAGAPGTAINAWDPNSGAALPAYLSEAQDDLGSNIPDRLSVPSLSYEGKIWQIVKGNERVRLQAPNSDGDMVPVPVMRVVIVGVNSDRGRAYYEGTYNPAAVSKPKCWSADGRAPDASVVDKQAPTCSGCPMSVKGSKVDQGREMVACSQHRMLAVVPSFEVGADPLRLKIAVTSDYDKEIVEHGWFAFRQYADWLKSRGVNHTGLVITKMKMDPNAPHPKILFALDRVLTLEELTVVKQTINGPKVPELLAEKWTAAGVNGTPVDDRDIAPNIPTTPAAQQIVDQAPTPAAAVVTAALSGIPAALADGWAVHPDNAAYLFKGAEVLPEADVAVRYPAPAAAPAPAPAAPPPAPAPVVAAPAALVGIAAAAADGWAVHPDNGAYWFKGAEVLPEADVAARYPGNAATPQTAAPAAEVASTSATAASPSDATIPSDVQGLLSQWAS